MIRRLRRVVILAPSLAILLVLAAAGAASAAEDLDLVEAAPVAPVLPSVEPKPVVKSTVKSTVAQLTAVEDRVEKRAERALQDSPARAVKAIVRRAEGEVGSVPPVPIPVVIPPAVDRGLGHVVPPRRTETHVAAAMQVADVADGNTIRLIPDQASSPGANRALRLHGDPLLRMGQPASPPSPLDASPTSSIGGSDAGAGQWLGHGSRPGVPSAWQPGFRLAKTFAMRRGMSPRPLVPPG